MDCRSNLGLRAAQFMLGPRLQSFSNQEGRDHKAREGIRLPQTGQKSRSTPHS